MHAGEKALSATRTYGLKGSRYRGHFVQSLPRAQAETWLAEPRALFENGRRLPGSDGPRLAVIEGRGGGMDASQMVVKRHSRGLLKSMLDVLSFRPSPALRAFNLGLELQRAGVGAARPLAAIERRIPGESFLILEKLEGCDLREYLLARLGEIESAVARRDFKTALWKKLAKAVARLHAAGVRQRDLKAPNILIAGHAAGAERVTLVDLEGMARRRHPVRSHTRARDLGRLAVSLRAAPLPEAGVELADWEELLEAYLEAAREAAPDLEPAVVRWWVEATCAWAERKEARNRRRGRPIR
jgi:tRNA A-37 threonylcarbamoyl transferase component Bud32